MNLNLKARPSHSGSSLTTRGEKVIRGGGKRELERERAFSGIFHNGRSRASPAYGLRINEARPSRVILWELSCAQRGRRERERERDSERGREGGTKSVGTWETLINFVIQCDMQAPLLKSLSSRRGLGLKDAFGARV
jgi:hypothetical protein